ncbi:MAG: hypothetical protein HQL22_08600 [Candidatus Omnitrophica bacterium]|nr:hypothetical protein [Candidatus Omnitrophota bacterium]
MYIKLFTLVVLLISTGGCASLWDAPKNIIGISTRDLESARKDSTYQVYQAGFSDVFNAVIEESEKAKYYVFIKDEIRGLITVMNITGVVNTTEVGVFLTPLSRGRAVKVELSSRSTPAKRIVAALLFSKLGERFKKTALGIETP